MKLIPITAFLLICFVLTACRKYDTDYKNLLGDHEVVYPGRVGNLNYGPGNLRAALFWNPSPDPSISRYIISWNNGADSVSVQATTHKPSDLIRVVVPNLKEYVYAFRISSLDANGNKSVPLEINNVRVYGDVYRATLLNRALNPENPNEFDINGTLRLNFNKADSTNTTTVIRYTSVSGAMAQRKLDRDSSMVSLPDYQTGTTILYKSSYIPAAGAIDTFEVADYTELTGILRITACDKSLFSPFVLPTDIGSAYDWKLQYLWDKSLNEPGFHTQDGTMPFWFTFDMGARVSLNSFRLWQRSSGLFNYGNPKRFEVWGSNNPDANGSWDNWTKLVACGSVKPSGLPPGQNSPEDIAYAAAGEKFVFPAGTPAVRYLRFRILETWGNTDYFHATELTFYKHD